MQVLEKWLWEINGFEQKKNLELYLNPKKFSMFARYISVSTWPRLFWSLFGQKKMSQKCLQILLSRLYIKIGLGTIECFKE